MPERLKIAAIVGSLRLASLNRIVFETTRELLGDRAALLEANLLDVPLFNEDLESGGEPDSVAALKAAVAESDGLIIFTPEYNHSIPAVTKNAVDWLSRPFLEGAIAGKPVGIVSATLGAHKADGVRGHLPVPVASAGGVVYDTSLGIASSWQKVADGAVADPETRSALTEWGTGFLDFVADSNRADGA